MSAVSFPTPDNKYVCAVDNGIDQIKMYKLNTQRDRLKLVDILRCERESGPREIVFSESGKYAYVIYELMNKVDVFSYRDTGNGPEFEKPAFRSTGTLRSCHEELAVQNRKADICPTAGEMVFFVMKILEAPR